MILLKQPITHGEYYLNKFAADLSSRVENYQTSLCWKSGFRQRPGTAPFTTFAMLVKRVLLNFLNEGRTEYNIAQIVDMANDIAEISGRGSNKYNYGGDTNSYMVCKWGWAFVKAFADIAKKSEDIKMAAKLWTRHEDGSASAGVFENSRHFLIETPDIHDSWSSKDYGVVEKWYALEDESTHYFAYKVFPSEHEARLFIAELVMKINSSWYAPLVKATNDITDAMAESYIADKDSVNEEIISRKKEVTAVNGIKARVYIIHFKDGVNKIGVSKNIEQRVRTKEKESGRIAKEVCATDFIDAPYVVESRCHTDLRKYRTAGEFFNCSYEQAQAVLQRYSPITVRLSL